MQLLYISSLPVRKKSEHGPEAIVTENRRNAHLINMLPYILNMSKLRMSITETLYQLVKAENSYLPTTSLQI